MFHRKKKCTATLMMEKYIFIHDWAELEKEQ